MKIHIINGPNLNLIGVREREIYGNKSFVEYLDELKNLYPDIIINYFQSNSEGDIIDKLQEIGFENEYIILNAGAYTHYSIAIRDAIKSIPSPVIEVHISNIHNRDAFRSKSVISEVCIGAILGFGLESYQIAIDAFKIKYSK